MRVIKIKLQSGRTPSQNIFKQAQKSMHYIMESDSMSRFLRQNKYTKIVTKHTRRAAFRNMFSKSSHSSHSDEKSRTRDSLRVTRSNSMKAERSVNDSRRSSHNTAKQVFSKVRRASARVSGRRSQRHTWLLGKMYNSVRLLLTECFTETLSVFLLNTSR